MSFVAPGGEPIVETVLLRPSVLAIVLKVSYRIVLNIIVSMLVLFCLYPGQCEASMMYVDQLEDLLKHCCAKKVAGFLAETIQVLGIIL